MNNWWFWTQKQAVKIGRQNYIQNTKNGNTYGNEKKSAFV